MRMTEHEYADYQGRRGARKTQAPAAVTRPQDRMLALGRLKTGEMNRLERSYAAHLEGLKQVGEVLWWKFEAVRFVLAPKTSYTPDFMVLYADGTLEAAETKGWMRDDAAAKLKIAAATFPIRFVLIRAKAKKDGGGFSRTEF